jgi:hypothetical protein
MVLHCLLALTETHYEQSPPAVWAAGGDKINKRPTVALVKLTSAAINLRR